MARTHPLSKPRRTSVVWDHRRDKYMLLAIFAQMNIRSLDFKQLAETLGNETYSADILRRRFMELRQMAKEVMEDRQDRHVEISEQNDTAGNNTAIPTESPAARTSAPSPRTPSPQPSEQHVVEPTPPMSIASTPLPRPVKKRAQTEPPLSSTARVPKKSRKDRTQLSTPKSNPKPTRPDQERTGDSVATTLSPSNSANGHTRDNQRYKHPKHKSQASSKDVAVDMRPKVHLPGRPAQAPAPMNRPTYTGRDNSATNTAKTTDISRTSIRAPRSPLPNDRWAYGPPPAGASRSAQRAYGGYYPGRKEFVFPSVYESFP